MNMERASNMSMCAIGELAAVVYQCDASAY